jgi:hypothetical protein
MFRQSCNTFSQASHIFQLQTFLESVNGLIEVKLHTHAFAHLVYLSLVAGWYGYCDHHITGLNACEHAG